ncbi:hypothetical protein B0T20DRAFT_48962 [Sordaria brevicollis]|uniref:Uncharacterized protein n=1 Tax=Sordaria brevicollis TaxID=83679 RepID=A0AAE0U9Z7_SORBR|nr:hypothetical protein B0T20DRAFT_48962 [Sordaria brevicollis]
MKKLERKSREPVSCKVKEWMMEKRRKKKRRPALCLFSAKKRKMHRPAGFVWKKVGRKKRGVKKNGEWRMVMETEDVEKWKKSEEGRRLAMISRRYQDQDHKDKPERGKAQERKGFTPAGNDVKQATVQAFFQVTTLCSRGSLRVRGCSPLASSNQKKEPGLTLFLGGELPPTPLTTPHTPHICQSKWISRIESLRTNQQHKNQPNLSNAVSESVPSR